MIRRGVFLIIAVLGCVPGLAQDQQAVSALGRLEPENGIIKVSASSTPQAILGAILVELHVTEGDDVETGQLLAVTDTAAVMEAFAREAQANLDFAAREVDTARSQATEACVRADVAAREAERRSRLLAQASRSKRLALPAGSGATVLAFPGALRRGRARRASQATRDSGCRRL